MQSDYRALLHEALSATASRHPGRPAVSAGDVSSTYAELDDSSSRLGAALQQRGLSRGNRVAIYMDNTVACATAIFGVLKAGGTFLVINPQTKQDKLAFIANDCAVSHLITDTHLENVYSNVIPDVPSLTHVICTGDRDQIRPAGQTGVPIEHMDSALDTPTNTLKDPGLIPFDLAALIYTSGSTGNPKGVVHTHQSMVFARNSIVEYLRLRDDEVIINLLPMAFDYGLYQLLMGVYSGATVVLERSFAYPAEIFKRIDNHRVTVFPGVPTVYALLLAAHTRKPLIFPSVRWITNTAAALPAEFFPRLREIFPNAGIFAMYGLTECKRVSYLEPEMLEQKSGSVGKAIPGTEMYLRTAEGTDVPPGEPGILYVRGPHVMRGYWNNDTQTRKMLHAGDITGERVLCTGDWFRKDEDGYFYFLGRSDDIIKSRGEKISPAEVENALYSIPGIREAAVIGIPDDVLGEAIRAFVAIDTSSGLTDKKIRALLTQRLENFMVPKEVTVLDSLPKSENGKITRKALLALEPAQ